MSIWQQCCDHLKAELAASDFNTWINPLQAEMDAGQLVLWAPNRFVLEWVNEQYLPRIKTIISQYISNQQIVDDVVLRIGSKTEAWQKRQAGQAKMHGKKDSNVRNNSYASQDGGKQKAGKNARPAAQDDELPEYDSNLNPNFTFDNFVEGKANQLARAAAFQVSENPGKSYNPFFMYGGVGLGKTHLMHAIGNLILKNNPSAKVLYLHSERFVADMVKALQRNLITNFKQFYRSVDVLLIDDIQFFANKDRSQEEFFHTFNALLDGHQQIILTSDRYPKEIEGVEERLKSRLGWGLTVAIEPPELETRVAILMRKAEQSGIELPHEVAFFIAKQIQSNVRDLEGALKRVIANAQFTGKAITVEFSRYALQDLLTAQAKMVTVENIQKTVAEYYKIKVADMLSKRRTRVIARPRQMAMALAKELTNNSLPEIGDSFGGRDHTTVLHACRKVYETIEQDIDLKEDWDNLSRILSC